MNTRAAPELVADERTRRLREAIAADPNAPLRIGIVAPGGYGKTAVLADLAAVYREAGVRVGTDAAAAEPGGVLLVDDAHRLDSVELQRIRAMAEADRARVIVAARPWPAPPGLVELGAALDGTTRLRPFDRAQIAALLAAAGVAARPGLEEFVLAQTGGVPALVDRVARAMDRSDPDGPLDLPTSAVTELGPELDRLTADVLGFLLIADQLDGMLHADLLGDVLGCDREAVADVAKAARATGLIDHTGRLIPIVRLAIRTLVPVDRRTAVRHRLAAAQLRRGPAWAETVALAGDLDTALRAADQVLTTADAPGHADAARLAAAALAHRGQLARSAELFRWSGAGLSGAFAVLGLIGTGQREPAERLLNTSSTSDGPPTLLAGAAALMANGVHASVAGTPTEALSTLVRAASLLEPADPAMLMPDSPAALAALAAVQCGELTVADSVLRRALQSGMGGAPFAVRHRLLRAWVGMAGGDLVAARERLRNAGAARAAGTALSPRDWLFAVGLEVGLARRTSDLNALRQLWAQAGEAVSQHPVDLYTLLPLGELAIAAARLGDLDRLAGHLTDAWSLLGALGDPPLWTTGLAWSGMHAAIITEQWDVAEEHVDRLADAAALSRYHAVLAGAARRWLDVLGGTVDPDAVEATARDLHAAGLRWDAARLAGQAAIRTPDRKAMAGLMECARLLQGESGALEREHDSAPSGGQLSERERQVARLVLAGLTYREVGDRLFISAKTVEHHIARIRQRLGATSRRELLAQLRELLGETPMP